MCSVNDDGPDRDLELRGAVKKAEPSNYGVSPRWPVDNRPHLGRSNTEPEAIQIMGLAVAS